MYCNKFLNHVLALALVATLVTACGGGGGGASASTSVDVPGTPALNKLPTIAPGMKSNELQIYVDAGPAGTDYNVNRLYTDVTVCLPGKSTPGSPTQCQTIDHVLVDTGSTGLRLLSKVMAPDLKLDTEKVMGGPLLNCAQFVDNTSAWGPVVRADIVLGGKTATNVPIQVIGDPAFNSLATATSCGGTAMTTAKDLGANGVLGVGLSTDDCGAPCADSPYNGSYYTCTDASCAVAKGVVASLAQQVKHPVFMFTADNNGMLIELPGVRAATPSLSGSLIFGIGTQTNNQLTSGSVLTADLSTGYITTRLGSQSLTNSFIDSGSNGLFFDSTTIADCGNSAPGFYCPTSPVNLSATLVGVNGATSAVSFSIDKATDLFSGGVNHVLPTLAGNIGDLPGHPSTFDWGLPFFYGRRVFLGIEGKASTIGTGSVTGPFYAF